MAELKLSVCSVPCLYALVSNSLQAYLLLSNELFRKKNYDLVQEIGHISFHFTSDMAKVIVEMFEKIIAVSHVLHFLTEETVMY